jgi:hypothetical protein
MSRKSKEADRIYHRAYYATHKEKHKEAQERYLQKNPRIHKSDSLRESRLRYLYKMTVEMYESLLSSQEGHCALCPAVQGDSERRMAVDHDHECCSGQRSCGKCLRGILCPNCNRKIGFLEAVLKEGTIVPISGTWLDRALQYLTQWRLRHGTNKHYAVGKA